MHLITPALFLGGSLLIAAPILIHLLNKRQFKILDWAAMDFLIEANKSNRRRIRLEDLLLLLLRCAAVLLIALLVARPYQTLSGSPGALDSVRYSRIVLLDDSYSMTARSGGQSAFAHAKRSLVDVVQQWAVNHAGDAFSLVVFSRPDEPQIMAETLSEDNLGEIVEQIKRLEPSSTTARLSQGLAAARKSLDQRSVNPNRLVYVVTDLRQRDWSVVGDGSEPRPAGEHQQTATQALRQLARDAVGCYLVDVSGQNTANLMITSVKPLDRVLVSGVPAMFDVDVKNAGTETVSDVEVVFQVAGALDLTETIGSVEPGGTAAVQFPCTFTEPLDGESAVAPEQIHVEIKAAAGDGDDCVEADSHRYYAARLTTGIQTLIVDGDPSPLARESESYFLKRALSPRDRTSGGVKVTVAGPSEFETAVLDDYQVVFLCNLESISGPRRESLEQWCRDGGGVVLAPGDQLFDPGNFNRELFREGKGLSPIRLTHLAGNEGREVWAHFNVIQSNHDLLRLFDDTNSPLLELAKIFRWWQTEVPAKPSTGAAVLARFTDSAQSPAIVEQSFGDGRVVVITTPLDDDWSDWPKLPGGHVYVPMMHDLVQYVARATTRAGDLQIGAPLIQPVNVARFRPDMTLTGPDGGRQSLQALPNGNATKMKNGSEPNNDAIWHVRYSKTQQAGFYSLELTTIDNQRRDLLFAASVDTSEGDLTRIDRSLLAAQLEGSEVQIVDPSQLSQTIAATVRSELWPLVIGLLAVVLCGELLLGWWIGNRRAVVAGGTGH